MRQGNGKVKVSEFAELQRYNTLRIPAQARALAEVEHWYELNGVLSDRRFRDLPRLVLGDGSNILFRKDFPGLLVRIANRGIRILEDDGSSVFLRIAAGENWHRLVQWAAARGLWGIENLALIPGTVGAAPVQNIGAYGVELSDTLVSVRALDHVKGRWRDFPAEDCGLGYRTSRFKEDPESRYWITEIVLRLSAAAEPNLGYPGLADSVAELVGDATIGPVEIAAAVSAIRRSKLPDPLDTPNVGSFFKNPVIDADKAAGLTDEFPDMPAFPAESQVKLSAAWLIDRCGFKGMRRGEAGVYERHALVLVNHGAATGEQVWQLALEIQGAVHERFGIWLEPEPLIV
ncbi:MAG: UDP-N-acetylmuramate dehydrogenase [Xanthomonadales bacterium]|nr:UDP-N-acetylmuramate dehydrogenase [Xanthomonadales bacterium]